MIRALLLVVVVVFVTTVLLYLATPQQQEAHQPAYCMGEHFAELCYNKDLREKTEFRA